MAVAAVCLVFLACLGAGAVVLRLLRVTADHHGWNAVIWSFAVGFGSVGWLSFFLAASGSLSTQQLIIFCVVCSLGVFYLRPGPLAIRIAHPWTPSMCLLLLAAAIVVGFSVVQGISPPTDADSLAYHFALPKQFIQNGELEFVPRAVDGAIPLLIHMTYVIVYGLGGEVALSLWTGVISAMAAAFLFMAARRYLDARWALATTLVFVTAPAFVYGGVSGQVETKLALFVVAATLAVAEGLRTGLLRYVALAGLMAGCYAGAKYLGLFFVVACAVPFLLRKQWLTHAVIYGIAAFISGAQWYLWNWAYTGDPTFPALFQALGIPDSAIWNSAHDEYFRKIYYGTESVIPSNPFWFVVYPFQATLAPLPAFESDRTGLGPFVLLALPFAAVGVWRYRSRIRASELGTMMLIAFTFYALWFFVGHSQRIRHLLPVYPLLLMCIVSAASAGAREAPLAAPFAGAAALTLFLQLGGLTLFGLNFARFVIWDEKREQFLTRTVANYEPVPWINANLSSKDKILIINRQLTYHIDIPVLQANGLGLALVELRMTTQNPPRFLAQLNDQGITHLLTPLQPSGSDRDPNGDLGSFALSLVSAGCAEIISKFDIAHRSSRTLSAKPVMSHQMGVVAITDPSCPL